MNKTHKASEIFISAVEKTINVITYPFIKTIDWMAYGWLKYEIADMDKYADFLDESLETQRIALNDYIKQNKALSARLEQFEKEGETVTLKHRDWLNGEVARLTHLVRELSERNESLSNNNSQLLSAGNAVAELVSVNKPKKRLTKKDKETQSIISNWDKAARRWM
jgi:hypothetical protein